jgi:hypothetical protein
LQAISDTKCLILWLSIYSWSKQESYGTTLCRSKSALRLSRKCNQTPYQTEQPPNTKTPGKVLSFQSSPVVPKRQLW